MYVLWLSSRRLTASLRELGFLDMDNAHYHEDILLLWYLHVGLSCCDLVSSLLAFTKRMKFGEVMGMED